MCERLSPSAVPIGTAIATVANASRALCTNVAPTTGSWIANRYASNVRGPPMSNGPEPSDAAIATATGTSDQAM
jgi:hypothetical protein